MKTKSLLCINRWVAPIQSKRVEGWWVVDAPHLIKGTWDKTLVLSIPLCWFYSQYLYSYVHVLLQDVEDSIIMKAISTLEKLMKILKWIAWYRNSSVLKIRIRWLKLLYSFSYYELVRDEIISCHKHGIGYFMLSKLMVYFTSNDTNTYFVGMISMWRKIVGSWSTALKSIRITTLVTWSWFWISLSFLIFESKVGT